MTASTLERDDLLALASAGTGAADVDVLARLLAGRYACRGFRPDPVPADDLAKLVALAQLSASWCNSQPWQLIITSSDATDRFREALVQAATENPEGDAPDFDFPERYAGVYAERRRETAWRLYDRVGVSRGDRVASGRQVMENFRLFGAPHAAILTSEADLGTYGAVDCGIFVGNFMLAAQAMGLATIPQAAIAAHCTLVRSHFDIPATRRILLGFSIGYEDETHPANMFRTDRAAPADVTSWVTD